MLQLKITINTTNAAFDINPELECVRILRDLADKLENNRRGLVLIPRDINGNRCGEVEITEA